jgi:hypothetical protein
MADRLTVLITNIWLANFGGSEVVVRDLALGLLRRGHRPIVYSPALGKISAEIAARGVAVIDDLERLGEPPDVIHGHHCIPCGEALLRFPEVPAINVCHAFETWLEAPAHFPQIGAYVAVDEACRDRLVQTEGIDPARVLVLPNAVDLDRIPARPAALPDRPRRALAFGKAAELPELRAACERAGIEFASLRAMNFGLRCLTKPVTVDRCLEQIARYDRDEAAKVAACARDAADLDSLIVQYEQLYADVIGGARKPSVTDAARQHAEARFLHTYLPRRPGDARWPWLAEREKLRREAEKTGVLAGEVNSLQGKLDALTREHDEMRRAMAEHSAIVNSRFRLVQQFWHITRLAMQRARTGVK